MTFLHSFFIKPFTAKGLFWGSIDIAVKAIALFVWAYITGILGSLLWQTIQFDYNRMTQLWWFSYCFLIFFGVSLLTYIVLFIREYQE